MTTIVCSREGKDLIVEGSGLRDSLEEMKGQ